MLAVDRPAGTDDLPVAADDAQLVGRRQKGLPVGKGHGAPPQGRRYLLPRLGQDRPHVVAVRQHDGDGAVLVHHLLQAHRVDGEAVGRLAAQLLQRLTARPPSGAPHNSRARQDKRQEDGKPLAAARKTQKSRLAYHQRSLAQALPQGASRIYRPLSTIPAKDYYGILLIP